MAEKMKSAFEVAIDARSLQKAADAFQKSMSKATKEWNKEVKNTFGGAIKDGFEYAMASGQSGKAVGAFLKSNVTQVYSDFQKALRQGNAEAALKYNDILDKRARTFRKELDSMTRASERVLARQDQSFHNRADGFQKALSGLGSGRGIGGLFRGIASRAQDSGLARQQKGKDQQIAGRAMGDAGAVSKGAQMAQFGKTLATIGKAAMGFAAVAGILLTLVKLFMDLEKRIKDMNKELMAGAGAADFGLTPIQIRTGALTEQLKTLRDETTAVNENFMKFRATAKEQQKILATFNQAGYTYARMNEEIKKGSSYMQNFSDVTAVALTYSRNLGIESGKIATDMGTFAINTEQSLEQVAESFSIIQREATVAGFVTKRFYSAIIEATSGMSFYGVRISETTELLKNFDSLMGEAVGTEMFRDIAREGGKSYQDSLKEFLVKDPEFVQQMYKTVYRQNLVNLERQFKGELPEGVTLKSLIDETGGGAALSSRLEGLGIGGQKSTNIMNLAKVKRAAETGDNAAMMGARGAAGPAFEAAMKMRTMSQLGGDSVGAVYEEAIKTGNEGLLVALEQLATTQGVKLDKLIMLDQKTAGRFDYLKKVAVGDAEMTGELKRMGFYIKDAGTENAKVMRGAVGETGTIIEDSGVEMVNQMDMLLTRPTEDAQLLKEQLTKDQKLAAEISTNITGLSEIMEQSTNMILSNIYDVLMDVYTFLARDDTARLADIAIQQATKQELGRLQDREKTLQGEVGELTTEQEKARGKGDYARVERLEKEKRSKEKELLAVFTAEQALQKSKAQRAGLTLTERLDAGGGQALSALTGKVGGLRGKDVSSAVDRAIPEHAFKDQAFLGDLDAMDTDLMRATFGDTLAEAALKSLQKEGITDALGEKEVQGAVGAATKAGQQAREALPIYASSEEVLQAEEEAFRGALKSHLVGPMALASAKQQDKANSYLEDIAESVSYLSDLDVTKETDADIKNLAKGIQALDKGFNITEMGIAAATLVGARKANDLIIPSNGPPIIPSESDTLMAFKPGGPIASALSGGKGGSPVSVNIYGGDLNKVYDEVMRVMKVLGHA